MKGTSIMPHVSVTLPETQQAVTRPIVLDIVKQICDIVKLPESEIFYVGDTGTAYGAGTAINSVDKHARFSVANRLYIEAEEVRDRATICTTAVRVNEHPPIFVDSAIGVALVPGYAKHDLTIKFKYTSTSETVARRWRDDIERNLSAMSLSNIHSVTYHYLVPLEYLQLLQHIYTLRERVEPYGQTFDEYLVSCASNRLTVISNVTGNEARLAVSETQSRVQGMYNFDDAPEPPTRDSNDGVWTIEFEYKLSFDKPVACDAHYPVIVHNQLIHDIFTCDYDTNPDTLKRPVRTSKSMGALASFESDTTMKDAVDSRAYIRIPYFDDAPIPKFPHGIGPVMSVLCELALPDKKLLLNLNEVDPYLINQDIVKFMMESEYPYMHKPYHSFLQVLIYRNGRLVGHENFTVDKFLNITYKTDLNPRDQHRVVLAMVTDLHVLQRDAIDRLRKYPKAFVKVIGAINELLRNHPSFNSYGDKNTISYKEFDPIYEILTGTRLGNGRGVTGPHYYGGGVDGANWPYRGQGALPLNPRPGRPGNYDGGLFTNLDPALVKYYRDNRQQINLVQNTGVIAIKMNEL